MVVTDGDIEPSDNTVKQVRPGPLPSLPAHRRSVTRAACSLQFLQQFHRLYIDTVCNPFHTLGAPLTSER